MQQEEDYYFFKVIDESKKSYIEQPKARRNRAMLVYYASKKMYLRNISIVRVLEALEKQGGVIKTPPSICKFLIESMTGAVSF